MNALLDHLLTRAQLRDPPTLKSAKAEFDVRLRNAELAVRLQIERGMDVSASAWQDVADAIYIAGKTLERLHGSEHARVRVLHGGYRAVIEATLRPGFRATAAQLQTISVAIDSAKEAIFAAQDLAPFQAALEDVLRAHAEARHADTND